MPCSCDSEACWGSGAAGCTALCRGGVFCCTLLHCPSRTMLCFLFAWMSRLGKLVGTNASMRRCCSRRRGQASKCRCSPSFSAPCSSLWVAGVLGLDFGGWIRWGASRPDGKKDSLKFSGGRAFPCRGFDAGLAFFNLGLALIPLILGRRCGLMEVLGCRHSLYLSSCGVSFYGCVVARLKFGSSFLLSSSSWLGVGFLFHGSGSFFPSSSSFQY